MAVHVIPLNELVVVIPLKREACALAKGAGGCFFGVMMPLNY